MSSEDKGPEHQELQFDRVMTAGATTSIAPDKSSASCTACHASIDTEYYSVNGHPVCLRCRDGIKAAAETPRGAGPLLLAGAFGLGAGLVGAAIYYAVIALANLEIGIVAILIGYMVGYAVRKGARGRGGRRFQVLAIALTYGAVALAYTPVVIKQLIEERNGKTGSALTTSGTSQPAPAPVVSDAPDDPPTSRGLIVGLVFTLGFIAALPVLIVIGSLPSGLISAAIIFFGMRQAWVMTGVPSLQIQGPFRIGADPTSTPA